MTLKQPLSANPLYILISKQRSDGKQLMTALNRELALMQQEGVSRGILRKHGLSHESEK